MRLLAQAALDAQHCPLMLSKNKRPYEAETLGKRARLRRNVEDLYSSGNISAERLTEVCRDFNRIDGASFPDVARVGAESTHMARWWRNRMKKHMTWLPHYWAEVRVLDIKTGKEVWEWPAFLIPHMR